MAFAAFSQERKLAKQVAAKDKSTVEYEQKLKAKTEKLTNSVPGNWADASEESELDEPLALDKHVVSDSDSEDEQPTKAPTTVPVAVSTNSSELAKAAPADKKKKVKKLAGAKPVVEEDLDAVFAELGIDKAQPATDGELSKAAQRRLKKKTQDGEAKAETEVISVVAAVVTDVAEVEEVVNVLSPAEQAAALAALKAKRAQESKTKGPKPVSAAAEAALKEKKANAKKTRRSEIGF